jgi:hypothetical protein
MNRYLLMTAAALSFGSTVPAPAAQFSQTHEIQFATSNGGSYCDGMLFYKSPYPDAGIQLGSHLLTGCEESNSEVAGKSSKTKLVLVEDWQATTSFLYNISKPIRNGGSCTEWACLNQTSCFELNSGIYKLGYTAGNGGPATSAKVADILAARKAGR